MEPEDQKPNDDPVSKKSAAITTPSAAETGSEQACDEKTSDGQDESDGKAKKGKELLSKLNEYKEIISIIVFFIGGCIWIYSTFATKVYVARIQCFLGATIQRVDNEEQSRVFQSDIIDLNIRLARLQKDPATADIIVDIETGKQQVADLAKKKSLADETAKKATDAVEECSK
ncbi:hypothetical protein [Neorhizobium sp. P12A]|uniref:hypothetical protein n=1 Tax=Neorhizobium sp. P12A TaxID=2268027 RepID=UPI0011EE43D0|nr:hypothetical protein [Neorhizobium sp. P12A]